MNKRKVKKKFKLTNREFKFMTFNYPNIFKDIPLGTHSFFACASLPYRICFVKGKRVTPKEYYNFLDEKSKKYDNIRNGYEEKTNKTRSR